MTLSPHARSTAAALLRWFATWLALIVLVQGLAAARALGSGPLHHHRPSSAASERGHHHDSAERHHHTAHTAHDARDALDSALALALAVSEPDPGVDSGAFALTAALALMALAIRRSGGRAPRPVWRPAPAWAWRTRISATPERPPRPA